MDSEIELIYDELIMCLFFWVLMCGLAGHLAVVRENQFLTFVRSLIHWLLLQC